MKFCEDVSPGVRHILSYFQLKRKNTATCQCNVYYAYLLTYHMGLASWPVNDRLWNYIYASYDVSSSHVRTQPKVFLRAEVLPGVVSIMHTYLPYGNSHPYAIHTYIHTSKEITKSSALRGSAAVRQLINKHSTPQTPPCLEARTVTGTRLCRAEDRWTDC